MRNKNTDKLLSDVIDITKSAGSIIMRLYNSNYTHSTKEDLTPVTGADISAHKFILKRLKEISDLPCISEESTNLISEYKNLKTEPLFWLVDPLDGTKEFINKNDEFTVNIALIENNKPIIGVIFCPALNLLYYANSTDKAYKQVNDGEVQSIQVAPPPKENETWKIAGSRYHGKDELKKYAAHFENSKIIPTGSSLKLCYVADGTVHLYPRLAPTCEWDTAAGQIIVEMAGGEVISNTLEPLRYRKSHTFLNPNFIACNTEIKSTWKKLLKNY